MDKYNLNIRLIESLHSMDDDKIKGKIKNLPRVIAACSASISDPDYSVDRNRKPKLADFDQRFLDRVDQVFPGLTVGENTG